jgi:hypothetical protein
MKCILEVKKCVDLKHHLYASAELINKDDWNSVLADGNIYLSLPYLTALEKALDGKIAFRYILFYDKLLKPVAAAYIQIIHFGDQVLHYRDSSSKLADRIKYKLLSSMDAKVLVCGNIFACGENGFVYTNDLEVRDAYKVLSKCMKKLSKEEAKNGQISFALFKEFWPDSIASADSLRDYNYRGFMLDVNMVFKILPSWTSMDDYLNAMTAKFRTKAKGVYKKSELIRVADFNVEKIIEYKDRIEVLYLSVLANAEYKFGDLNSQSFVNFKKYLKEQFIFKAYFLQDKMIGFSSVFLFNKTVDANYIGLDYEYNKSYSVYQRMLYDFVDLSIAVKAHELRLGRTAELIKSSIGALPVNMKLYVRHINTISNQLLMPFISSISPNEFELRSPFK